MPGTITKRLSRHSGRAAMSVDICGILGFHPNPSQWMER